MNGLILSDCGRVCACSGEFKKHKCKITKINYPVCDKCGEIPKKLRVRKNLIGRDGKVFKKDFTEYNGKTLKEIVDCVELIGQINRELHSESYTPEFYSSKLRRELEFDRVANTYLDFNRKRNALSPEHEDYLTPSSLKTKTLYVKNHLIKYFQSKHLDTIGKYQILEFFRSYPEPTRTRDLALGELKTVLHFAKKELELIKEVPAFPELKRAKQKKAEEIPSLETQAEVILNIKNKKYRDMWTIASVLAKRPSEVRAYKVKDIEFKDGQMILITQRHFSYGPDGDQIIPGRKSMKAADELGTVKDVLNPFLASMLTPYLAGRSPEDFIFPGDKGEYVICSTFTKAWKKSCEELGLKIQPYVGSKHATLSGILGKTGDLGKVLKFSKHTNEQTLKRYAKFKDEDVQELIDTLRFEEKSGGQVVASVFNDCISLM